MYLSIYLQAWKRSYSARRPQFLNLTTSKTQQFSETSSIFAPNNMKNEASLRDFLFLSWQHQIRSNSARHPSKTESWVQSWRPRTNAFSDLFSSTYLKYCACHERVLPGHTKCCTCHAKSSQQTWRSEAPKCNPPSGNQRPDLLTALINMSLVLRLPRKMHLCRSSSNVPRLPSFLEMLQNPHVLTNFDKVHNPLRLPRETTSEHPKVA